MSNILILNAHHEYPFSTGKLTGTLVQMAQEILEAKGHQVRVVRTSDEFNVEQELENHKWADTVILQSPVNWMGVPWSAKRYMDEVYTAGMGGDLCNGDGRSADAPDENYGTGGTLEGKKYMLSLTFNAPKASFDKPGEYLFQGKSVDDLWFPMHMNFRFFGMEGMETFAAYDVMKNPNIESDLVRFNAHLDRHF